ncbi:MAG: ribosome maturation factor RimP [Ruminiclostridium sp.]|nr:ribosome maturation factor RimP [Ruminiclostridium sp.]
MTQNKVTEVVAVLARPIIDGLGLELVDVEFVREGPHWYLRIFIDKPGGITLEDCEAVHRPLSDKLDRADPIPQAYMLEVSSPGVERPFKTPKDYEKAIGHQVQIKFYKPVDGSKACEGILEAFDGESVTILVGRDDRKTYSVEMISKINRMILF